MQIFAPYGAHIKWAKGACLCLNGAFSLHNRAPIATAEPGNCPRESFSLPLKGHSQGRWNQGADFLNMFAPTCNFLPMHSYRENAQSWQRGTFMP